MHVDETVDCNKIKGGGMGGISTDFFPLYISSRISASLSLPPSLSPILTHEVALNQVKGSSVLFRIISLLGLFD